MSDLTASRSELNPATLAGSVLLADIEAALDGGHIAVVLLRCEHSIDAARIATRGACHWLNRVVRLPLGGLSRSATPGLAAVAAWTCGPLGVDVEALVPDNTLADLAPDMLHRIEQSTLVLPLAPDVLLSLWVRKEAVLKSFGVGLAGSPKTICTGPFDPAWVAAGHSIMGPAAVRSLVCPPGFSGALAIRGDQRPQLAVFEISPALLPGPSSAGSCESRNSKGRLQPPFAGMSEG